MKLSEHSDPVGVGSLVCWNLDAYDEDTTPTWIGPLLVTEYDAAVPGGRFRLWDSKNNEFFWAFCYEISTLDRVDEKHILSNF